MATFHDKDRTMVGRVAPFYGFQTVVTEVLPMVSDPHPRIKGQVVPVVLACGHTRYYTYPAGNHTPGDSARCWDSSHQEGN